MISPQLRRRRLVLYLTLVSVVSACTADDPEPIGRSDSLVSDGAPPDAEFDSRGNANLGRMVDASAVDASAAADCAADAACGGPCECVLPAISIEAAGTAAEPATLSVGTLYSLDSRCRECGASKWTWDVLDRENQPASTDVVGVVERFGPPGATFDGLIHESQSTPQAAFVFFGTGDFVIHHVVEGAGGVVLGEEFLPISVQ